VKQTTQYIVGAAGETDREIVHYSAALYQRLGLSRIYFSAYQKGPGHSALPGESETIENNRDPLTREHRLYQVDFLFRKYGFAEEDIACDASGQLDLSNDPKQVWANRHPEFFPLNPNKASKFDLLKVPGLGPITVNRILYRRRHGSLTSLENLGKVTKTLEKARNYLTFS
jgi:predicted DNA-binding helix-hairpin-helix protein